MAEAYPNSESEKCSICIEPLTEKTPRALPCLHTFCDQCLRDLVKANGRRREIACPQCRKPSVLPPNGIDGLPINFHIKNKEEINHLAANCKRCEEDNKSVNGTVKCLQCKMCFCHQCAKTHNEMELFNDHKIIDLYNIKCKEHQAEIQYVCTSCNMELCAVCVMKKAHKDHQKKIEPYKEARKKQEELAKEIFKKLQSRKQVLDTDLNKISNTQQTIDTSIDQIEKHSEEMKRQIEQTKCEMIGQLSMYRDAAGQEQDLLSKRYEKASEAVAKYKAFQSGSEIRDYPTTSSWISEANSLIGPINHQSWSLSSDDLPLIFLANTEESLLGRLRTRNEPTRLDTTWVCLFSL